MKKKLSSSQIHAIQVLSKYDCAVMYDGWLTGGCGIKLNLKTVDSLKTMKLIQDGRLTEFGKKAAAVINQSK